MQASLSKPQPESDSKTSSQLISSHFRVQPQANHNQELRNSMMMTRPPRQSKPAAANNNNNNNLGLNPLRPKPLTAMNRHPTPTASQMSQQQQPQQEVWNSTEDLFWDHMREVQNKWNTLKLNDDIWAKLIYFEQNRRLAKAYVSTPVLTIDGSTNGLDGFRIGLSGIENSYRNLDSIVCLRSIGQGIKLKIDQQGNILIRKLVPVLKANQKSSVTAGGCPVWVKEWPKSPTAGRHSGESSEFDYTQQTQRAHQQIGTSASSSANSDYSQLSSCSSSSTPSQNSYDSHRSTSSSSSGKQNNSPAASLPSDWSMQEIRNPEQTYKLFDMQEFRLQLERTKRRAARNLIDGTTTTPIDWRQCVSIISFDCARQPTGRSSRLSSQQPLKSNSQQQQQVLNDPCWLMLINIIAIDMLKSSVCDSTPSPGSQTSSLVNRYQSDNNIRTASRKLLPPLPALERPLDDESEQPRAALPTFRNHPLDQVKSPTSTAVPDQVVYKSERLRRLNQIRNQIQPEQVTDLSGKHQQSRAPVLPQGRVQHGQKTSHQQQPEGSIYTTFTGKYLDKQHRMRADKQRNGQSTTATPVRQVSVDDFDLERGPHLVMSKLSRRDASYQNNIAEQGDNSQPLYPIDSMKPGRRLSAVTRSNCLAHSPRHIDAPRHNQQLTHSLSAFDLSHGLKLNLRSINASAIKMNFDDDEVEEFEGDDFVNDDNDHLRTNCLNQDHDDQGLQMGSEHVGLSECDDLFAKLDLKPKEKTLTKLVRSSQQKIRSAHVTDNNSDASSEWINLAKKFSLFANSNDEFGGQHQESARDDFIKPAAAEQNQLCANKAAEDCEEMISVDKQHCDEVKTLSKSPEGQLEGGNKLQQNVSRSSIASSSSGCADNDYFISQSSPSSMSSSTRSNGEELSSQPASSSGIISGSASDDYERRQTKSADAEIGLQPPNRIAQRGDQTSKKSAPQPDSKTKQHRQSSTSPTSASRSRLNEGQLTTKMDQQSHRSPSIKQAISLSRGYNGKSVDLSPQTASEVATCKDCEHLNQTVDQCDCGVSSCDQMMYAVDQDPPGGICDCFCDCLYHPNDGMVDLMGQQTSSFIHPTRCQDELLCDCGQDVGQRPPARQLEVDEEEPIYDHLPRFGLTSPVNERPTSRTTTSNNTTRQKLATRTKSSGKVARRARNEDCSRKTINEEDYDCIVPLPMSSVDRNNSSSIATNGMDKSKGKSISATNLKRTSGWLEGSKYIKLLPRFMPFASSSSSTSSDYANRKQDEPPVKSGTLDRATQMVNKFRRTRSSQNLFK